MSRASYTRGTFVICLALAVAACQPKAEEKNAPPSPPLVPAPSVPEKPKITKLDDLPRHTYPVAGSVLELVTVPAKFSSLATQVRANLEHDLEAFQIDDKTTRKRLKGTLLALDLLEGRDAEARTLIVELKQLEDKPALRYMSGFLAEARLDVIQQTGTRDYASPELQKAYQAELEKRLAALPWNVVGDELKRTKASFEIRSRNLLLGVIENELEPAVKKTGSLSNDLADTVIGLRSSLEIALPLKQPVLAALTPLVASHSQAKPDIWKDRDVTLAADAKLTPVVIGIWDSGVDPKVYPKQLFTDPNAAAGKSDPHGLAFDLHSEPVHGELYPLGPDAKRFPALKSQIKGILDMQAAVDSPEAEALRKRLGTLQQAEVKSFLEDLSLFGNYAHGTHVAGIASKGNPAARLLIARITFDYHLIPERPTIEQARKDSEAYRTTVAYLQKQHTRVVNMSWGGSLKDVEEALEKNGVGDAEARKKEAREIFEIGKVGLYEALKSAPDILFVTAAGNSNNDVNFDEVIPSSFKLPNLVTVGAVDQAGEETSFTSFGADVTAYANGFQVDSPIPGGSHLRLSGTSMASPQVANLAAKLFALDPKLTPVEVVERIKGSLDVGTDPRIHLVNPRKALQPVPGSAGA